ncbi:MAG: ABC transporter ATP-binding protein [Chlorobi bacterium]|nr:ABC transporter ATP-binding protein [Chlorobiota bacterium]
MKKELALEIININKIYKIYDSPMQRLKELIFPGNRKYHQEFQALKNINLSIKKGEVIGIIGENGAGKSTLLKIMAGILTQTSGTLTVNGKISTLLELGVGFNLEMTGVENIFLYGTIMKLSKKEISQLTDKIIEFAEIGDFINRPVKTYSAGMFAKLAFSVAVNISPDILIIDEILSVGDAYFQQKSFEKIAELRSTGATIIFCSHSLYHVQEICDNVVWLKDGEIAMQGEPLTVTDAYTNYSREKLSPTCFISDRSNNIFVEKIHLNKQKLQSGEKLIVKVILNNLNSPVTDFKLGIMIKRNDNIDIFGIRTDNETISVKHGEKKTIELIMPNFSLLAGRYYIIVYLFDAKGITKFDCKISEKFEILSVPKKYGIADLEYKWKI